MTTVIPGTEHIVVYVDPLNATNSVTSDTSSKIGKVKNSSIAISVKIIIISSKDVSIVITSFVVNALRVSEEYESMNKKT